LTRTHLNYHRISEDLDFTYIENEKLNKLSSKQRKKAITRFTNELVGEIDKISKKFNLDFSTNKRDKKYCKVMDRKNVYVFRMYYRPNGSVRNHGTGFRVKINRLYNCFKNKVRLI